jgi:DeoR/GlpR family transcriptional regulator of sugar metabolism
MGEVVASIRDNRGATSILEWVRVQGGADTLAVAARFCMETDDARRELRHLERKGLLRGRRDTYGGYRQGGVVLMWEPI